MDNACIIGYGVVGQATARVFGIDRYFDVNPEKSNIFLEEASRCKFIFICLPTPVLENGLYETSSIYKIINQIEEYGNKPIYIIRSTVYPGFASLLKEDFNMKRIISNPEFLNEDTAEQDMKNAPFILLGGEPEYVIQIRGFYQARIKGAPVITTDNTTAEMAKLTMNAYFATKVVFANDAYDACQILGANYETVKNILEAHPFGPKNHFAIFHKGYRGFGGSCLPKDAQAYAYYAGSQLIKKVNELNNIIKGRNV